MTVKMRALILGSLTLVGTALTVVSDARASNESDKAEVTALIEHLYAVFSHKDLNATMACFSDDPDAVFFEDTIPFQMNKAMLRKDIEVFFNSVSEVHSHAEAVSVQVSGDLAAAHLIQHDTWTDQTGTHSQTARYTQIDRKEGGKWLIWHEHLSLPFDPVTGKAIFDATP